MFRRVLAFVLVLPVPLGILAAQDGDWLLFSWSCEFALIFLGGYVLLKYQR